MKPVFVTGKFPSLLNAHLAGSVAPRLPPTHQKSGRARRTDSKTPRRRSRRATFLRRFNTPFAKIKRMALPHIVIH